MDAREYGFKQFHDLAVAVMGSRLVAHKPSHNIMVLDLVD